MLNMHGANRIVLTDPNTGKEYEQDSNKEVELLTLTNATANTDGSDVSNVFNVGAVIAVDVTAITGDVTITVEGKIGDRYYPILATAAIAAVGTTILRIHPSLAAVANSIAKDMLPNTFRVRATLGGITPSVTATVKAALI